MVPHVPKQSSKQLIYGGRRVLVSISLSRLHNKINLDCHGRILSKSGSKLVNKFSGTVARHIYLDALFHKLHSDGIGVQTKHTEILIQEDKKKLWTSGVMS